MNRNDCVTTKVVKVEPLGKSDGNQFLLTLSHPGWSFWKPGQFVMIRPEGWENDPVWARPFSIADVTETELVLLIQVAGRGTQRIRDLDTGTEVVLWGALGNWFAMEENTPTLMLGGGIGLAPFMGYSRLHPDSSKLELLFGHTVELDNFPVHLFEDRVATINTFYQKTMDDLQDFIALIKERMDAHKDGLVLACGPTPFMRTIRDHALENNIRCQVSLENTMACGVGACLGCVCKDKNDHHIQVCSRGPVFWADDLGDL